MAAQGSRLPVVEVSPGFEPGVELLQSSALPLGYDTIRFFKKAALFARCLQRSALAAIALQWRGLQRAAAFWKTVSRSAFEANREWENTAKKTSRQGIWERRWYEESRLHWIAVWSVAPLTNKRSAKSKFTPMKLGEG
jgi:hypothetical protein